MHCAQYRIEHHKKDGCVGLRAETDAVKDRKLHAFVGNQTPVWMIHSSLFRLLYHYYKCN